MDYLTYPKPNFVRENYINLDGEWDFIFDESDVGEREPRYKLFPKDCLKINVPYCYQSRLSGINKQERHDNIWYHREVKVNLKNNQRALLHIGAADYFSKIYVNHKLVGSHKGGYTEFCFDITDYIVDNIADIVIFCNDTYALNQPRGKQKWRDQPFGCWYQEVSGIWKSVFIEIVGDLYIENMKFTPLDNSIERVELFFNKSSSSRVDIEVSYLGNIVFKNSYTNDGQSFVQDISIRDIKYWDVNHPNLYDVNIKIFKDDILSDEVKTYFGYRFIKTKDRKILINNQEAFLRLVLEQGYYEDGIYTFKEEKQIVDEVNLIKSLGFNGLRMHQKVEDARFYYLCDKLGLFVWSEMPSTYEFDEIAVDNNKREWKEILKEHYNHPSIIVWTPCNECWGVPGVRNNIEQQEYLNMMYDLTKEYDQTRLVVSDDGWLHCKTDIVTLHNYVQDPEVFKYFIENVDDIVINNKRMDNMNEFVPFASGYHYEGQPIMYDEFCGIGYNVKEIKGSWGYGTKVQSENSFFDRFSGLIKYASNKDLLAGWCVTQISDVYQEVNGLVTMGRKDKFNKEKLNKIISGN